ncbi:MAG: type II secretion system F family protein [Firmicutes bacterium]|nr:type II secretion system F family protein [Bacillota bacterium]
MPIKPIQKPVNQSPGKVSLWQMNISDIIFRKKRRVPVKDLALFCRKMAYLLASGLQIKAALPIVQGKSLGGLISAALPQIHIRVMKGDSFSDALKMEDIFPEFMVGFIAIGEKTAQLAKVCEKLADYYELQARTRREIIGALIYPIAVLMLMFGVIVLAMVTVLPGYAHMFEMSNAELPVITAILLNASSFFTENIYWLAGGVAAITIAAAVFAGSSRGKSILARAELKIPLLRQAINLHLVQALSLLLGSGIRLSEAVFLSMGITENILVKKDLLTLSIKLSEGHGFSESLEAIHYTDPLLCDLSRVGEKTGDLARSVERCLECLAEDYKHSVIRANKLIEPIITIIMGVLIALVMLAVVLPTFELAMVV